jgi:hypothetical protein
MASIRKEVLINARPEHVWAAIRDFGALHHRLVPGFVTNCRVEDDARIVTFANGMVARELLIDLDEKERRLAWAAIGGRLTHHNASIQVFGDGDGHTRAVWIADLLPNELAAAIREMIDQGAAAMKKALELVSR